MKTIKIEIEAKYQKEVWKPEQIQKYYEDFHPTLIIVKKVKVK